MDTIDILSETQINFVYPKPNNSKLRILKPDQQGSIPKAIRTFSDSK